MKLVLSHMTALDTCSRIAVSARKMAKPCRIRSLDDCVSAEHDLDMVDLSSIPIDDTHRMDVLVPNASHRFRSKRMTRHVWNGPLPDGSFYRIADDVVITSPEFSLLLLSKPLAFNELVRLCSETCSRYAAANDDRGFIDRPPITSLRKIARFVGKCSNASGATKLRRALAYSVENARSPMEAAVGIMMSMPARLGGFGLGKPSLNYRINLKGNAAALAGRGYVELDLYYPAHEVALEYDSSQYHAGTERRTSDARRNNVLRSLGLTVINLTWDQVRDPFLLEGAMGQAAKAMGKKLAQPSERGLVNRLELYSTLLPMAHIPSYWPEFYVKREL